ncbi:MAG: hypothetical protein JXB14_06460 [Candidatus Altiarchaeota archaeon]|nr:hypothetical protein [Candidatus Altiarchaeota archaeon]
MLTILLAETDPGITEILHRLMLNLQASVLNRKGCISLLIHFRGGGVLKAPLGEVPQKFEEFEGFFAKLKTEKGGFEEALKKTKPGKVVVMSPKGENDTSVISGSESGGRITVVVGGFTKGDLSEKVYDSADYIVSLSKDLLDIWTVIKKVLIAYEKNS